MRRDRNEGRGGGARAVYPWRALAIVAGGCTLLVGLVGAIASDAPVPEARGRAEPAVEFAHTLQARALAKARRLERRGRPDEGVAVLELALEQIDDDGLREELSAERSRIRFENRPAPEADDELWVPASTPRRAAPPAREATRRPPSRVTHSIQIGGFSKPRKKSKRELELEAAGYVQVHGVWLGVAHKHASAEAAAEPVLTVPAPEPAEVAPEPDRDTTWSESIWEAYRDVRYHDTPGAALIHLRRAWRSATETQRRCMAVHVATLLEDGRWPDRAFARWALQDATGEELDADGYRSWVARYVELRQVGHPLRPSEVDAVLVTLSASPPGPLLDLALEASEGEGLLGAIPVLVETLDRVQEAAPRQRIQVLLRRLTGADPGAGLEGPALTAAWAGWVDANAEDLERKILVGELVAGGERAEAVAQQVGRQGKRIVPQLLEAYAEHPRLQRLHTALGEITGLDVDPSPEAWRVAWSAQ